MRAMLNSIAVEPHRWTQEKIPHFALADLLGPIREAGFDKVEVWQYHVSRLSLDEVRALRSAGDELGLAFPVQGSYPRFHLEGEEARLEEEALVDLVEKAAILGAGKLKMFLGRIKGTDATPDLLEKTAMRLHAWEEKAREKGIVFSAELHGGTLFDPVKVGEEFLRDHPELDIEICYQPFDFGDHEAAMTLAGRFADQINHVHLQGRDAEGFCLLKDADIDYRELLPKIERENRDVTYGIEFTKDCTAPVGDFDLDRVLANARADAEFVEEILGG